MVEQGSPKPKVPGSSPGWSVYIEGWGSLAYPSTLETCRCREASIRSNRIPSEV